MNTSPLSGQFSPKLEKLNREIHAGLSEVRRHLKALEETEKSQQSVKPTTFSDLLDRTNKKRTILTAPTFLAKPNFLRLAQKHSPLYFICVIT